MKPSSAMAFVSAGVMSAARAVVSVALPVKMVTAVATANAALLNLLLVVLIVPFTVPLWDLGVYRTLGQYIRPCCLRAFDSDRFWLEWPNANKVLTAP